MIYKISTTKSYRKEYRKLRENHPDDADLLDGVVYKLSKDEILDKKFKDHKLQGALTGIRRKSPQQENTAIARYSSQNFKNRPVPRSLAGKSSSKSADPRAT